MSLALMRATILATKLRRVGKGALATCPPSVTEHAARWWARFALPTLRQRSDLQGSSTSKRRISAVDYEAIRSVIRRRLAHDVHRDATKIRGLAEAAHRDARHHVGDEFVVPHDAGSHVALDPAGQDRVRGDAVARQFNGKRAAQRVQRRLRAGVMLVAGGAEQRRQARGCDQPAELVAGLGAFGHVASGNLKHMEDAVEGGREHAPPFLLGAVDEGARTATADAGIGEAAVDPA